MSETAGPSAPGGGAAGMLDPMTRAVAGLVLAVVGLMGPNLFVSGVQLLTEGQFGGAPSTFMFWMAVGSGVVLGLGLWLALAPARGGAAGWVASVARAAVVVAAVGLAGCALLVVGAVVHSG